MDSPIYIIVLFILIFLFAWFLMKFLFYPIFFKPRLNSLENLKFLEKSNCVLVAYVELTKNEKKELRKKSSREIKLLDKLISFQTEYKLIAYSTAENKHKMFWVEIFQKYIPHFFGKRHFNFIEERDSNILNELMEKYDVECNECGLELK